MHPTIGTLLNSYLFVYGKTFHCNHAPREYFMMTGKSQHIIIILAL